MWFSTAPIQVSRDCAEEHAVGLCLIIPFTGFTMEVIGHIFFSFVLCAVLDISALAHMNWPQVTICILKLLQSHIHTIKHTGTLGMLFTVLYQIHQCLNHLYRKSFAFSISDLHWFYCCLGQSLQGHSRTL